mgnify:CR=1 FL=1
MKRGVLLRPSRLLERHPEIDGGNRGAALAKETNGLLLTIPEHGTAVVVILKQEIQESE